MPGGFDGPEMAGSQLTVFEYDVHSPPYLYLTVCILSTDHIDHFKIKRSSHLFVFLSAKFTIPVIAITKFDTHKTGIFEGSGIALRRGHPEIPLKSNKLETHAVQVVDGLIK